jgi:hypothetical protein
MSANTVIFFNHFSDIIEISIVLNQSARLNAYNDILLMRLTNIMICFSFNLITKSN